MLMGRRFYFIAAEDLKKGQKSIRQGPKTHQGAA